MDYHHSFLPKAYDDLRVAVNWYDERSDKAGDAFVEEMELSLVKILSNPFRYKKVNHLVHRCLLKTFPYVIFYTIEADEIVILRIRHSKQRPLKRFK